MHTWLPAGSCSPLVSAFAGIGYGVLVFGGVFVWALVAWLRSWRGARRAAAAEIAARGPLPDGGVVTVFGTVADDGGGEVVSWRIYQHESRYKGNSSWDEPDPARREHHVRPFDLTRPTGETLRVEPDEQTILVAELGDPQPEGAGRRSVRAAVAPGQEIYVTGRLIPASAGLTAPFRDASTPAAIVPAGGDMTIVPASLRTRHLDAARALRVVAITTGVLFFGVHSFTYRYDALLLFGRTVSAEASSCKGYIAEHTDKHGRTHTVQRYALVARDPDTGVTLADDTSADLCDDVSRGRVTTVPFVVAGGLQQIGDAPTLGVGWLIGASIPAAFVLLGVIGVLTLGVPVWYARRPRGRRARRIIGP